MALRIDEEKVIEAIKNPTRIDLKHDQYFAIRVINAKYALSDLRKKKDYLVVITFYPVRRERYGL